MCLDCAMSMPVTCDLCSQAIPNVNAGKALREVATKGMDGILSQEPTVARHALALALHLAQHNAPQLLESQKDLTTVVAATCSMYEASGEQSSQLNFEIPV